MILSVLLLATTIAYSPALKTPGLTCKAFDTRGVEIERSEVRKRRFWKMTGYSRGRTGYVVNHIVPLACGGCDIPSNMEWMTIAGWKGRTGPERNDCGRHAGGEWR